MEVVWKWVISLRKTAGLSKESLRVKTAVSETISKVRYRLKYAIHLETRSGQEKRP